MWKKLHRSGQPWFLHSAIFRNECTISLLARHCAIAFFTFIFIVSCSENQPSNQSPIQKSHRGINQAELNIWWDKGFNLEEDAAFRAIVDDWQRDTGNKVKLSFYPTNELSEKIARKVRSGNLPDLIMSQKANPTLYPRLAWNNKLEDVSDVIEPVKDLYSEQILKAVTYSNGVTGESGYYGIPVHQATIFIFYWQKLLSLVGLGAEDIPEDWDSFWQFWQEAQFKLANQQNKDIYGLGLPFSVSGSDDIYLLFEHILEAYDVRLVDEKGKLLIDRPQVRQGIIKCLDWYSQFYLQGFVPPDSINWLNTDNNRNLLNRVVLMTPNVTLSIPGAVREDKETYYKKLGIVGFPDKPNGEPMRYIITVKQAVIFANSPHVQLAKDFMRYFIQPEVTIKYLQASGHRNQPVQNSIWQDSFWEETTDPYLKMTAKILKTEKSRLSYTSNNPAYSQVLEENIWGKTLNRIVVDRLSPEQAADEAIARIKEIFNEWEN